MCEGVFINFHVYIDEIFPVPLHPNGGLLAFVGLQF